MRISRIIEVKLLENTYKRPEIIKWVLSFGAEVAVIRPEAVREAVIKHAKGMIEKYEE